MNNQARSAPLDLSRFIAAIIVLLGHFIFIDKNFSLISKISLLGFFQSGAHAVLFFFTLSGFVLTRKGTNINFSWLVARLVRLLPVYFVCFVSPVIALAIAAPEELLRYPLTGLFLALLASQALSSEYYLTGPNSPLWSLSVEVWLSIILFFFAPLKKPLGYMICFLFFVLLSIYVKNPIIHGAPYFFLGVTVARFIDLNDKVLSYSFKFRLLLFLPVITYWFVIPVAGIDFKLAYLLVEITDLIFLSFTLLFFLTLCLGQKLSNVASYLGRRSFALYAIHAPVLRFFSQLSEFIAPAQDSIYFEISYLILGLALVALTTEVLYRFIEIPSIKLAAKIRS